jgi:hypothetical protein
MKKIIVLILAIISSIIPQEKEEGYLSEGSRKIFGDYLFCSGDYLRAIDEYMAITQNDTIRIKTAVAIAKTGEWRLALERLSPLRRETAAGKLSRGYYYRIMFENSIDEFYKSRKQYRGDTILEKLYTIASIIIEEKPEELPLLEERFSEEEKSEISELIKKRRGLKLKSPETAAIISAVMPGGGKVYTENYGDAITSFIPVALFTYLAIANFNADHKFRGYLFSGLAGLFYAGGIYGAYTAAQIYNAGIKYSFNGEVELYLKKKDYFFTHRFCN